MSKRLLIVAVLLVVMVGLLATGAALASASPGLTGTAISNISPPAYTPVAAFARGPSYVAGTGSAATPHPVARAGPIADVVVATNNADIRGWCAYKDELSLKPWRATARTTATLVAGLGAHNANMQEREPARNVRDLAAVAMADSPVKISTMTDITPIANSGRTATGFANSTTNASAGQREKSEMTKAST